MVQFIWPQSLNSGHSSFGLWLVEAFHLWGQLHVCPVPLSHSVSEFTCSRQRQLSASTFGRRRKSVWFEVVCGSPSCGSGGAHSSQCQCASLEGDLRAHCCCSCLAISVPKALPRQHKVRAQSPISQNLLQNEVFGAFIRLHQASFSTPCLSATCSDIKWLL